MTANLRARWGEIALCLLALFLYGVGNGYQGDALNVINTIGPVLFSLGLLWGIVNLLQRSVNNLWVPLFWYRVAMLTYFGIGALVSLYASEDARAMMKRFYDYYPDDLLRLNILLILFHSIFISVATAVLGIVDQISKKESDKSKQFISKSNFSLGVFGTVFIVVGALTNIVVILPSVLGIYNLSALGQISNLSLASLLGFFMLTLWSLQNKSGWLFAIIAAAALESLLGLLEMTKFIALFPSVMVGLGFVFHKASVRRLAVFAGSMMIMFTSLAPVIGYARNTAQAVYSGSPTPLEVASIYQSYYTDDTMIEVDKDAQQGWMRLSYVNVGVFAMNQFDAGRPGDSLRYAPIIWVPRLLYPDKPNVTDVSREFTYAVNGNYDSSSSPGIPAEAYWTLGWPGIVIIAAFMALIFTLWSLYTYIAIEREAWHLFFVVLIGMRTASRLDGAFVADIMGPIGLAVLAHVITQLLNRFLPERLAAFRRGGKKAGIGRSPTAPRGALTTRPPSASSDR